MGTASNAEVEAQPAGTILAIEPATGLHFHDVAQLLAAFDALIRQGHTVICVEHNIDVMAAADHMIDLGPGGGKHGGLLVASGTPEIVAQNVQSNTATFLKERLNPQNSTS